MPKETTQAHKGLVIIYRLMGGGGGENEDFGGITWFFWEQKGGSVVTENPKVWKDSEEGPLKFAWKMKTWVGGVGGRGSRKSSNVIGGITLVK